MADSNRTEKPTPRRRQKAREKGQVARSREIPGVLALAAAIAFLSWRAPAFLDEWGSFYRNILNVGFHREFHSSTSLISWTGWTCAAWVAPALLASWGISVASSVLQGGLVVAPSALNFDLSRLSPAKKLGQMFSLTGLSGLLKSLIPLAAIAFLGIRILQRDWDQIGRGSIVGIKAVIPFVLTRALELSWKATLVLAIWAGLDYLLVWRKMEGDLRMSRQELRDEAKETEGNPAVKGRIRRLQRQVRRQRMLNDTKTATVVVTNPTHFAVALRYELNMEAPVLVAKGRDLFAEQIKQVARWEAIPLIENPPLAQAIYRTVEVGHAIPSKLYTAVAEILAFVFRVQAQARRTPATTS